MRNITRIFVHCTATRPSATIDSLRVAFKVRGWRNPGYHYVVEADGNVVQLLAEEKVANGVRGHNENALHVAYVGGIAYPNGGSAIVAADTRTPAQRAALRDILAKLKRRYPKATILGHRSIWGEDTPQKWLKQCPCFNAPKEYADINNGKQP